MQGAHTEGNPIFSSGVSAGSLPPLIMYWIVQVVNLAFTVKAASSLS